MQSEEKNKGVVAPQVEPLLLPAPKPKAKAEQQAPFSKAFDNFIGDNPDDVEGLLAYALYKRTIRDQCRNGISPMASIHRDPPESEMRTYRASAAQMLSEVMTDYEDQVSEDWKRSYYEARLGEWKGEIKALIRNRTSMVGQIGVNLIAWIITIILSLAVYFAVRTQTIDNLVREQVETAMARQHYSAVEQAKQPADILE